MQTFTSSTGGSKVIILGQEELFIDQPRSFISPGDVVDVGGDGVDVHLLFG